MKRIMSGNRFKIIVFSIIFIILLISISVLYNQNLIKSWKPTEDLIGTWTGEAGLKGEHSENRVSIQLIISEDGSVTGKIGEAELLGCKVMRNRNRFEKWIGIKNDYIIKNGSLDGSIAKGDTTKKRNISVPFDITDGNITGSLFELGHWWEYPDPLFPRLKLLHNR